MDLNKNYLNTNIYHFGNLNLNMMKLCDDYKYFLENFNKGNNELIFKNLIIKVISIFYEEFLINYLLNAKEENNSAYLIYKTLIGNDLGWNKKFEKKFNEYINKAKLLKNKLINLNNEKIKFCELHKYFELLFKDKELRKNKEWINKLMQNLSFQLQNNQPFGIINCKNEQKVEKIIDEYLSENRIIQFKSLNYWIIKNLLEKNEEFINFVNNQNPLKEGFLALLGSLLLFQLEDFFPKLLKIDKMLPEVRWTLYEYIIALEYNNQFIDIYERDANKASYFNIECRLHMTILLRDNIIKEKILFKEFPEKTKMKDFEILREKFKENHKNAYLWFETRDPKLFFNFFYFELFLHNNINLLYKITKNSEAKEFLKELNKNLIKFEERDPTLIFTDIRMFLSNEHYNYLKVKLNDSEEFKKMIKISKCAKFMIFQFLANLTNYSKLIKEVDLIDDNVYFYNDERLTVHYLTTLFITNNDFEYQKIKYINEMAVKSLIWLKFMEEKINPKNGKDYEKNFVLIYEDLIKIENKYNNIYEEIIQLLIKEMNVTEEEYKNEAEIQLKN
ncbi:hypothetical protein Mgra_00004766, partial [Meloidogyne graminicola]